MPAAASKKKESSKSSVSFHADKKALDHKWDSLPLFKARTLLCKAINPEELYDHVIKHMKKSCFTTHDGVESEEEKYSVEIKQLISQDVIRAILTVGHRMLSACENLIEISVPSISEKTRGKLTIVGDLHGTLEVLDKIFTAEGLPSENNIYLFNGDYVDRGSFSVEIIACLLMFKIRSANTVHMLRGNHETTDIARQYTFFRELVRKYEETEEKTEDLFQLFVKFFHSLPLACRVHKQALVLHGGCPSKGTPSPTFFDSIDRFRDPTSVDCPWDEKPSLMGQDPLSDIIWSDPTPDGKGCTFNTQRNAGCLYGADVTQSWIKAHGVKRLIRSHSCIDEGFFTCHTDACWTVFSVPRYNDMMHPAAYVVCTDTKTRPKQKHFITSVLSAVDIQPLTREMMGGMADMVFPMLTPEEVTYLDLLDPENSGKESFFLEDKDGNGVACPAWLDHDLLRVELRKFNIGDTAKEELTLEEVVEVVKNAFERQKEEKRETIPLSCLEFVPMLFSKEKVKVLLGAPEEEEEEMRYDEEDNADEDDDDVYIPDEIDLRQVKPAAGDDVDDEFEEDEEHEEKKKGKKKRKEKKEKKEKGKKEKKEKTSGKRRHSDPVEKEIGEDRKDKSRKNKRSKK
ncbi:hypothetical protein ADUPG1_009800 [Aduncisulcus paluster]|uniref:Serine/threonine-protein phosphatase n=1 Tax=Aduncisulcus paluster TaxID=2918883 RepID=A0ABQ5KWV7_9EUKA|nr:hypothetical protein ADUPG1_009800 [Aduncisulcus paluster]|eukprot:gnl/Carplike_NY0171/587_a800_1644.p1 GENE.gnl/Carplike_NY0171/587_a800_1644~~gnl/Carplike_NY0171/587_a800_1644.p1  ORF type:complete len:637 (-),score=179.44 gnl/Carplike_NY0171/587_a800_1644:144-2024(-)